MKVESNEKETVKLTMKANYDLQFSNEGQKNSFQI